MTVDVLTLAILSLDSYNRGYDAQLSVSGDDVGGASVLFPEGQLLPTNAQSVGFYATAYNLDGQYVISYRGTDTFNATAHNAHGHATIASSGGSRALTLSSLNG